MKNFKCIILSYLLFFCFFSTTKAQYIEPVMVRKAISTWKKQAIDTVNKRRIESNLLRKDMTKIVEELKYEPLLIFGPNNDWINENMNLMFERPPVPFGVHMQRAAKQLALEKKHIDLYWADLPLYRWKKIYNILDSIEKLDSLPESWTGWKEDSTKMSKKQTRIALDQRIANLLLHDYGLSYYFSKEQPLLPKKEVALIKYKPENAAEENKYLIDNQFFVSSYPVLGQFNFYVDEQINKAGNVIFEKKILKRLDSMFTPMYSLWAEWADNKKVIQRTKVEMNQRNYQFVEMNYTIPNALKKNTLYCFSIVVQANEESSSFIPIWNNYFRTSAYGIIEKIEKIGTSNPKYDIDKGAFSLIMDEPFDQIEISERNERDKNFRFSTINQDQHDVEKLVEKQSLPYFMTVPKITEVDTVHLDNIPEAELDNTADALFLQQTSLGNINWVKMPRFNDYIDTLTIANWTLNKKNYLEKDSIIGPIAPIVTKADFERGKIDYSKKCFYEIYATGIKSKNELSLVLQKNIQKRMEERASFLYLLAVRAWKRNPSLSTHPIYASFLQKEKQYLPLELKALVHFKTTDLLNNSLLDVHKTNKKGQNLVIWKVKTSK